MHSKITAGEKLQSWLIEKAVPIYLRWYNWRDAQRRRNHKCLWRVYRDGGGGKLVTPKAMTQERAVAWVIAATGGEILHVDFEHRMIFYIGRKPTQAE